MVGLGFGLIVAAVFSAWLVSEEILPTEWYSFIFVVGFFGLVIVLFDLAFRRRK